MRVYLDNCCYNRPYDDQGQILVFLETQAKLEIQRRIKQGEIELVSSYMLDFEQDQNPYVKQKFAIEKFIRDYASYYVDYDKSSIILERAKSIMETGIKYKDAIHVACAIEAKCDYLISADKRLLKFESDKIKLINPIDFAGMKGY